MSLQDPRRKRSWPGSDYRAWAAGCFPGQEFRWFPHESRCGWHLKRWRCAALFSLYGDATSPRGAGGDLHVRLGTQRSADGSGCRHAPAGLQLQCSPDPRNPQSQCRALQARSPEQASLRPPCLFWVQATHGTVLLMAA